MWYLRRMHTPSPRLLATCLAGLACLSATPTAPLPTDGITVLFVGNSLTYVNDLPATVAAIGASAGDTIHVVASVAPDLALIDHLTGGSDAVAQMRRGGWKFVGLQQGPTMAGMCRDSLVLWAGMYAAQLRGSGATLALLMPWPGATHLDLYDEVRVSFEAAALDVNGMFVPAGEAWRTIQRSTPELSLYGADGFHPSPAGTFLAALVVYERVTGRDARTLPAQAFASGRPLAMPEPTIRAFQSAAHDANVRFPASTAPSAEELARPSLYNSGRPRC
jgi:hypothetical protein